MDATAPDYRTAGGQARPDHAHAAAAPRRAGALSGEVPVSEQKNRKALSELLAMSGEELAMGANGARNVTPSDIIESDIELVEDFAFYHDHIRVNDLETLKLFIARYRLGLLAMANEAADHLREDAARYRYLRNRDSGPEGKPPPHGLFIGMVPENLILTEEHADLAIDQGRKAHRHLEVGGGGSDAD